MFKHIYTWLFKSIATFLVGLPITILSPFITAIALPFRAEHPDTDATFTDPRFAAQGFHRLVTLPRWAKWWDNIYDGMWGDKRGWWNNYCLENYGKNCKAFLSMWLWNGIRNPANYYSRHVSGIDVTDYMIEKLLGDDEAVEEPGVISWQFLMGVNGKGVSVYRLFCVVPWWFKPTHGVLIDIGWKIKLAHNKVKPTDPPEDRFKGSVFTLSPWKAL